MADPENLETAYVNFNEVEAMQNQTLTKCRGRKATLVGEVKCAICLSTTACIVSSLALVLVADVVWTLRFLNVTS